jgi:hypothetical protein
MPVKEAMKYISVRNTYFASFLRFFYWNLFRQCGISLLFSLLLILFSGHPGISVNELSPLSLRRWNIRHFKFDFHCLKMADSLLLEEVTSPRKRELICTRYELFEAVWKEHIKIDFTIHESFSRVLSEFSHV